MKRRFLGFTKLRHAELVSASHKRISSAFTLAEVLITLGIIGIVAQMTLPDLISNVQDAEYKVAKDKVRMSIAEAGKILAVSEEIDKATSAEDFVKNYLSKQLKIIKYCAPANMEQCGMPSGNPTTFRNLYNANVASMPTTWMTITDAFGVTTGTSFSKNNPTTTNFNDGYTFLSADGISVNMFYNPYCVYNASEKTNDSSTYTYTSIVPQFPLDTVCMSGVYDMNGLSKPNEVGKDIGFFGVFYNGIQSDAVATLPYKEGIDSQSYDWKTANSYCGGIKGYKLPTLDELSVLYLGKNITGMPNNWRWSTS